MEEFFQRWNLNEASQEAFNTLDMGMQNEIMELFAPRDTSRDANGLFMSFVRSRSSGALPPNAAGNEMFEKQAHHEDFFNTWNLHAKSQQALLSLPPSTQADVMLKFQPRDTSRDVNPLFLSFVRGSTGFGPNQQPQVPVRSPGFVQPIAATHEAKHNSVEDLVPATPESVQSFCMTWNLNEEAVEFLEPLMPKTQTDIMDNFHPRDTSRDVNRIFLSFARSRACMTAPVKQIQRNVAGGIRPTQGGGGVVSRGDLQRKWNLNHASLAEFDRLHPVAQQRIIAEFNPRDTSRDANSCFVSFCKSRAAFIFAEKWNLNPESIQMFNELSAEKQQEVLRTFSPRDTSRDVNNVFKSYVTSRLNPAPAAGIAGNTLSRKRPLDKLTVFVEEWKLKPHNVELIDSLSPEHQAEVMMKFRPRDASRDCNSIFAKFVMSMTS
eukprot:GEMP01056932.1.p1 GENE.GEMP01056932.1~~GEMP01056932.1.p1  ORF type:complete len:436 (-),score=86.72 GEMP01056932.1:141-1448(-)